jgi:enoyl-CoA hydratase
MPEAKRTVFRMLERDKPIIARVNGHAVGLGATIALFCDIIIAADHAKIGDPHVRAGLVAGDGGALIWPQLIGFARQGILVDRRLDDGGGGRTHRTDQSRRAGRSAR